MKKINLKNLSMDEVLSKDELKKIAGGNGSDVWPQVYYCACFTADGVESDWYTFFSDDEKKSTMDYMDQNCQSFYCNPIN